MSAGPDCVTGYSNAVAPDHPEAVPINGWRTTGMFTNQLDATRYCPNCGSVWIPTKRGGFWIHGSGTPSAGMICELADALRAKMERT